MCVTIQSRKLETTKMALFFGKRDIGLFNSLNKELLSNIIEQKVGYYKISLENSESNMYGESKGTKNFLDPVLLSCLITPGDFTVEDYSDLKNVGRSMSFTFLMKDLMESSVVPDVGDIVVWNDDYYKVDNVNENQYLGGKIPDYQYLDYLQNFGSSFSITCECHLSNPSKLGLQLLQ